MIYTEIRAPLNYKNQVLKTMENDNNISHQNSTAKSAFQEFNIEVNSNKVVCCLQCFTPFGHSPTAKYVRCPRCSLVMNCNFTINYQCKKCGTLLSSSSVHTLSQCPACFDIANIRERKENENIVEPINTTTPKPKLVDKKEKRLRNTYMLFCKINRKFVSDKYNGKLSFSEIGVKLGEMWRELSANEKHQYQMKFKEFQQLDSACDSDRSYIEDSTFNEKTSSYYSSEEGRNIFNENDNQLLKDTFEGLFKN
eukprot:GAHX01003221.1.p1 GENE.GAHX01003221.1~~GAHX01003221.1.p1  ORF type:complete len:253 (-),score=41.47 GAHX01003221.1:36-794(-)